ncbi:MAG: hypothetical protein ABEI77_00015, partial [Halorientalis sp.]
TITQTVSTSLKPGSNASNPSRSYVDHYCRSEDGVQPVLLVIDLDRGFIDRNVVRFSSGFGL